MKTTVTETSFIDAFGDYNRADNFSYNGKRALFGYFTSYEAATGIETELDIIAICCEFNEYESLAEFHKEYDKKDYPDLETISDHTQVISIDDDAFIIVMF